MAKLIDYSNITDNEITLGDIVFFLFRNKKIIVLLILISALFSFFYALRLPVKYQVKAMIFAKKGDNKTSSLTQMAALAGLAAASSNNSDITAYLPEIVDNSDFIVSILNQKFLYKGDSLRFEQIMNFKPDTSSKDWKLYIQAYTISKFRNSGYITLNKDNRTSLFSLVTISEDPLLSFQLNNCALDRLNEYLRNNLKSQAKEKRLFIEDRLKEAREDLFNSENELMHFREKNISSMVPTITIQEQQLQRQVMINQDLFIEMKKQYESARIEEKDDQLLLDVIRKPELPLNKVSPDKKLIVIGGIFIGFFISIMILVAVLYLKILLKRTTAHK